MIVDATSTSPTAALTTEASLQRIRSVRVEVVTGPDGGKCLHGASERIVVGTDATADLVLTDRTVSRFHLELVIEDDSVVLRDLGSRNGTILDGVDVEVGRLRGPTIVAIGKTELRIDLRGDRIALDLAPQERFGTVIGAAPVMRLAFTRLAQAALHDRHVLIEGERGTGKDAAAATLHELSARRDGPLDVIDCTGPVLQIEMQLFGRGSDPGALARCHRGTIILDEIGALSPGTQRQLIRALEDKVVRRSDGAPADVRAIALSRRNLRIDVNADRFAPELFELISGARIRLPPLRERAEDIPLLVQAFIDELDATGTRAAAQLLAAETIEQLRGSTWPGNVRELRAYIEQAIAGDSLDAVADHAMPPLIDGAAPLREARRHWLAYFERAYVSELLARTNGNVSAAASVAGVDRVYMHRMITRCGLRARLSQTREGGDPE